MTEKKVCEHSHQAALVVHSRVCPLCALQDVNKRLIQLLIDKGVLPEPPDHDHSWAVLDEDMPLPYLQLIGPNWGMCMFDGRDDAISGGDFILCTHDPFPTIELPRRR